MTGIGGQPRNIILALVVEGGLAAIALVIGWLLDFWPAIGMGWQSPPLTEQLQGMGWGVVATLPLLAALFLLDRYPLGPIEGVRQQATEAIGRLFPNPRLWQLAAVSLAAGIGEEMLFRGFAQEGLSRLIGGSAGPWIALMVAAGIFGAFHWLSATYALLAMLAGLYFGWLLLTTGSLWTPIVAHALYDFVALWHIARSANRLE